MRSALLCASSAERIFIISRLSRSAERDKRYFHGRGRNGKRHLQRRFLRKRGAGGNTPSVFAAQSQLPQGDVLWQCRKLCRRRQKPSPWGRWLDAKRQDGRGKLPPRGSCQNRQVLTEGVPSCEKIIISGSDGGQKPKISITACFSALKKVQNR